mgnify:CR=1 FL=1
MMKFKEWRKDCGPYMDVHEASQAYGEYRDTWARAENEDKIKKLEATVQKVNREMRHFRDMCNVQYGKNPRPIMGRRTITPKEYADSIGFDKCLISSQTAQLLKRW